MDYQSEREIRTYRCSIRPELLSLTLKRGGLLAGAGALLLIVCGTILPMGLLKLWGIPVFFVAMIFIALGWLPYKRLSALQIKPHTIQYDGSSLIFLSRGIPLFKIATASIDRIVFLQQAHLYGLGIWLKRPIEDKVKVLQQHFNFASFASDCASRFEGCDLFLPYFSQRVSEEIKDLLESDHAS